jgi:hypothetical protein
MLAIRAATTGRSLASLGAVIVVSLIVGFAIGSLYYSRPPTTITSSITTITTTSVSASTSARFYEVAFTEQSNCSPPVWQAPWGVIIDGKTTIVQPSNTTLPLTNNGFFSSPSYGNYSVIWFSLPNGAYTYSVIPRGDGSASSGNITVSGSDTTVQVYGAATVLCTVMLSTTT